jgi:hypothetical protein
MLKQLVHRAFQAHYRGDAEEFRLLRDYLTQYDGDAAVRPLLHQSVPPRWYYKLRRGLEKQSAKRSRAA